MNIKTVRLLGLGRAAGNIACGATAVISAISRKRCRLVIIAEDCGGSTFDKFTNLCSVHSVPHICVSSKNELGKAVGYDEKAVVGITDEGLAKGIAASIM